MPAYHLAAMPPDHPVRFDPSRSCDAGHAWRGREPLARMRRLTPFLSSAEGEAAFALRCSRDADGRALIEGEVEAELWVSCQRCLGQLRIPVRQAFRLAVVHGLDEAERLPVELDPLLVESGQCELLELLEDELLLALPQVPMHEPGECGAEQAPAAQQPEVDKDNPFAVLAALKDEQSRT